MQAYLGTVVSGRRGVENGQAGGDLDFSCRWGEHFLLQEEERVV